MAAWVMEGGVVLDDEQHDVYEQVCALARSTRANEYDILLGWYEMGHVDLDDALEVAAALGDEDYFRSMLDEVGV